MNSVRPDTRAGFFILVSSLLLCLGIQASAQTFQRVATANQAVSLAADGRTVVAGDYGGLLYSPDGGVTWSSDTLRTMVDFVGVAFWTADSGIAVGKSGEVATTSDWGRSWTMTGTVATEGSMTAVSLLQSGRLIATDSRGSLHSSSDRGASWEVIFTGDRPLNAVATRRELTIACGDSGTVLVSRNDGRDWDSIPFGTTIHLRGIGISEDAERVAVVGDSGRVFVSVSGGSFWADRSLFDAKVALRSVACSDDRILVGGTTRTQGGVLMVSPDGTDWTSMMEGIPFAFNLDIRALAMNAEGTAVAVGNHGLIAFAPKDSAWGTVAFAPLSYPLGFDPFIPKGIAFSSAGVGTIAGVDPHDTPYLTTTTGGVTWRHRRTLAPGGLSDVDYRDSRNGVMIGNYYGPMFVTTDGGLSWTRSEAPVSRRMSHLQTLQFVDATTGVMVGDSGFYTTTNGGQEWSGSVVPGATYLLDVEFESAAVGFISGFGQVLKTTDGGGSWTSVFTTDSRRALYVTLTTRQRGLVLGGIDQFYRTSDGGTTWDTVAIPGMGFSSDALFIDSLVGYMVGTRNATLLETRDGGDTWTRKQLWDSSAGDTSMGFSRIGFNRMSGQLLLGGPGILAIGQVAEPALSSVPIGVMGGTRQNQYLHIRTVPNPVQNAPQTITLYGLYSVKGESIRLKVHDVLGAQVADLTSQLNFDAGGATASVVLTHGGLSNGTYMLTLTAGRYVLTQRIVIYR